MASWGKVNINEVKKLQKKIEALGEAEAQAFYKAAIKELAARLLSKVIRRTPVGIKPTNLTLAPKTVKLKGKSGKGRARSFLTKEGAILEKYWNGYSGGTLRRGWLAKTHAEATGGTGDAGAAEQSAYINGISVKRVSGGYEVEIVNPVEYASYVEYGHRQTSGKYVPALGKRLKKAWVPGKFMLMISEQELEAQMPGLLEKKLNKFLMEVFKGGR